MHARRCFTWQSWTTEVHELSQLQRVVCIHWAFREIQALQRAENELLAAAKASGAPSLHDVYGTWVCLFLGDPKIGFGFPFWVSLKTTDEPHPLCLPNISASARKGSTEAAKVAAPARHQCSFFVRCGCGSLFSWQPFWAGVGIPKGSPPFWRVPFETDVRCLKFDVRSARFRLHPHHTRGRVCSAGALVLSFLQQLGLRGQLRSLQMPKAAAAGYGCVFVWCFWRWFKGKPKENQPCFVWGVRILRHTRLAALLRVPSLRGKRAHFFSFRKTTPKATLKFARPKTRPNTSTSVPTPISTNTKPTPKPNLDLRTTLPQATLKPPQTHPQTLPRPPEITKASFS